MIASPDALRRLLWAPGEIGLSRAYVTGELDVEGDLADAFRRIWAATRERNLKGQVRPATLARAAKAAYRLGAVKRPLPPPVSEARPKGRLHSKRRDSQVISHHYDLSNALYTLLLDEHMAYSCAYWTSGRPQLHRGRRPARQARPDLPQARPATRCPTAGRRVWLGRALGARGQGVRRAGHRRDDLQGAARLRPRTAGQGRDRAPGRPAPAGLPRHRRRDRTTRSLRSRWASTSAPRITRSSSPSSTASCATRAACSRSRCPTPPTTLAAGRSSSPTSRRTCTCVPCLSCCRSSPRPASRSATLHALREHYVRTVEAWHDEFERRWDEVVGLVGLEQARVWRLYLVGGALTFEENRMGVDQILSVKPTAAGRSGLPPTPARLGAPRHPRRLPTTSPNPGASTPPNLRSVILRRCELLCRPSVPDWPGA